MSDASAQEPTAPERATGRRPLTIALLLVALIIVGVSGRQAMKYHTHRWNDGFSHGYNAGACQAKQDAIKEGYKSYLKVKNLGFDPTFTDGASCKQVFVVLTKEAEPKPGEVNGHTVRTTCERAEIQLADENHITPWTTGVNCTTVDTSTNKVSVGQKVDGG
jgi:hypothetical protein